MTQLSCEKFQDLLEDQFNGEALPEALLELQSHVDACPNCQALSAEYALLRRGTDQWATLQQPQAVTEANILRAAQQRPVKTKEKNLSAWWQFLLQPTTIAFASVLLIVGIGFFAQKTLEERQHPFAPQVAPVQSPAQGEESELRRELQQAPAAPAANFAPASRKKVDAVPADSSAKIRVEKKSVTPVRANVSVPPPAPELGATADAPAPMPKAAAPQPVEAPSGAGGLADREMMKEAPVKAKSVEKVEGMEAFSQSKDLDSSYEDLIRSGKSALEKKDCSQAMKDLRKAKKIRDSQEVRDLILKCEK